MSTKEGIHTRSLIKKINMVPKHIVYMHITTELKAYWLTCCPLQLNLCFPYNGLEMYVFYLQPEKNNCTKGATL